MWEFKQLISEKYGLNLHSYQELHHWSINNIADFWQEVWRYTGITASRKYEKVILYLISSCFTSSILKLLLLYHEYPVE